MIKKTKNKKARLDEDDPGPTQPLLKKLVPSPQPSSEEDEDIASVSQSGTANLVQLAGMFVDGPPGPP